MSADENTARPSWPKSEPTAGEMIRWALGEANFHLGVTWGLIRWKPGEPGFNTYMHEVVRMQLHHDVAALLRALREVDPTKADEMARFVWGAADAGDSYGEWLYQWMTEEGLDADAIHAEGVAAGKAWAPDTVRWELVCDAIRGFLMERHIPFDQLDPWADELVAIVQEHSAPHKASHSSSEQSGKGPGDG